MKRKRRALFVACGPTGPRAWRHREWGDLVTLNRALLFFPRVDLALFGTGGKVGDTEGHWGKAARLGALFGRDDPNYALADLLPRKKLLRMKPVVASREPKGEPGEDGSIDREAAIRDHVRAGNILGRAGAALVWLKRLGYRELWLFGHDGGHGRAPRLKMPESRRGYDKSLLCTVEALDYLGFKYAFWPDRPEES